MALNVIPEIDTAAWGGLAMTKRCRGIARYAPTGSPATTRKENPSIWRHCRQTPPFRKGREEQGFHPLSCLPHQGGDESTGLQRRASSPRNDTGEN